MLVKSIFSLEAKYIFFCISNLKIMKEGSSFGERFKREVISSPCFEMLKKSMKGFEQFIQTKLVIFPGVIVK